MSIGLATQLLDYHYTVMKYFVILACLLSWSASVSGQDLSGHWSGNLPQSDKSYIFTMEVDMEQNGNELSGKSKFTDNYGKWVIERFVGAVVGDSIYLQETEVIKYVVNATGAWCVKHFAGVKEVSGNTLSISGRWTSNRIYNGRYYTGSCAPGNFVISKPAPVQVQPKPVTSTIVSDNTRDNGATITTAVIDRPVVLKNVLFVTGKDILLPSSRPELDQLTQALQKRPELRIRIDGHTDKIGNAAKNLKLSQQRAQAVKKYLIEHGIAASRVQTDGHGDTSIICPAPCEANRRVEFTLVK